MIARLRALLGDREAWPLLAAFALLCSALWLPSREVARDTFELVIAFDVTQSMNVADYELDGRFVSRLDFARRSARRALAELPCGSKVGWAAFAEYRTVMLIAPIEVCTNYHDLLASLDQIDWRLRWGHASEVAKGVFWALRGVKEYAGKPDLIFISDGHESPPQSGTGPQMFDDLSRGEVHGWIVGAGSDAPQPIPRTDAAGKPIGHWRADEVVQRIDPVSGTIAAGSREHLSQMHEPHLRAIAEKVGLGFARLDELGTLGRLMRDPRHARPGRAEVDLAWLPASLALALLVFAFRPAWRNSRRAAVVAASAGVALALAAPPRADAAELAVQTIAPGAYFVPGHHVPWGPAFVGQASNSGFVIGERCVALIDSGGSPSVGRDLLAALRRFSTLPLCYVISTHVHPDHVLGNSAFARANGDAPPPTFVGHHKLAAALAARAPFYLAAMKRDFDTADQATEVPAPSLAVNGRLELDLGARKLELRAWPTGHTDNDLTVFDAASGTLWLGDLVFDGHLPVLDGSLRGWRAVLRELQTLAATQAVPGHGPVLRDWPGAVRGTEAYLAQLESEVRAALREGLGLAQTIEKLGSGDPAGAAGWRLVEDFHRRNLTAAFAELEWAE